jgi:hypothetical protein
MKQRTILSATFTSGSATQYASGDSVGTVQTLTDVTDSDAIAGAIPGRSIKLAGITLKDSAAQNSKLKLLFFDGSAPTLIDNVAFAFGSSLPNLVGVLDIDSADYSTIDSKGILSRSLLELYMKLSASSRNFYVACVSNGTPTYGNGGTVTVIFTFEFDISA